MLLPALLLLLALPDIRGRYNDDFDDGEDLTEFDDNDFAEFEDVAEEPAIEAENTPPTRQAPSSAPEEEEDEDEATVENEDGQDEFEDGDGQVSQKPMSSDLVCSDTRATLPNVEKVTSL